MSRAILVGVLCFMVSAPASGWRLGDPLPEEAILELGTPVRFSDVLVAGTPHLITLENRLLRFTDVWGMREVGRVRCKLKRFRKWQAVATLETRRSGGLEHPNVKLVFRYGHKSCTVQGRSDPGARFTELRELALAVNPARADVDGIPQAQSDEEIIYRALARFVPSLEHCVKSGERAKWKTDDERFIRCACPIVERWPLPAVKNSGRVSVRVLDFAFGLSLDVGPTRNPKNCRVWAGREPPEGEPEDLKKRVRALRLKGEQGLGREPSKTSAPPTP